VDELVAWLPAQLDEDTVEIAKHPDGEDPLWIAGSLYATAEENYPCTPYLAISKRRALAEVHAKRRILDTYVAAASTEGSEYDGGYTVGLGVALRFLALPYAGRPGYRDEWRPE